MIAGYQVLYAMSTRELEHLVTEYLQRGWMPCGGVFVEHSPGVPPKWHPAVWMRADEPPQD